MIPSAYEPLKSDSKRWKQTSSLKEYLSALGLVILATILGLPLTSLVNPAIQMMLYLAAVVAVAYRYGIRLSSFASVLAVICLNFFFVPPRFTLLVDQPSYWLSFFGLFLNGLLVSWLTGLVKAQSRAAKLREADALTLLAVSRDLAQADSIERITQVAETHLGRSFGTAHIILSNQEGHLVSDAAMDKLDLTAANEAYQSGQISGKRNDTQSSFRRNWHPLQGPSKILGVAGLEVPMLQNAKGRAELLEAILNQVAAALERHQLAEKAQAAELLKASERLQKALLNSVSHDLRIPLVSIHGALTGLKETTILSNPERTALIIENALSETSRLNRLVGNLLQKTRLDGGHLVLNKLPCDVEDLIATTLSGQVYRWEQKKIETDIESALPLVPMDFVLITQVLVNLIENAIAYSTPETIITIKAYAQEKKLFLEVLDRGVGLDGVEIDMLFERFERGKAKNASGIGLGLSICRGLVEAHDGQISARPRPGGGAIFSFWLPLEASRDG